MQQLNRLVGEYDNVPKNVKLMSWIPQNDLLGLKILFYLLYYGIIYIDKFYFINDR